MPAEPAAPSTCPSPADDPARRKAARLRWRAGLPALTCLSALLAAPPVRAVQWQGQLDLRLLPQHSKADTQVPLGKLRFEDRATPVRLGQAVLAAEQDLVHNLSAHVILSAADDRPGLVDLQEAWLSWRPLPSGAWRARLKAGAFFAPSSVEIDYDSPTWTPAHTQSSSVINAWIGEELRTKGLELNLSRLGRHAQSDHDVGATLAVFAGNDPAGSLLAWRGWTLSERISGLSERRRLPDLPILQPGADLQAQSRDVHVFREIDGRLGFYAAVNYRHANGLEIAALHYDNRGNPLALSGGQYAWRTRFQHLSLRAEPGPWTWRAQLMQGNTLMGPSAVNLDFRAGFVSLERQAWNARWTLRLDRFSTTDRDATPADANGETGHALSITGAWPLSAGLTLVGEWQQLSSQRDARSYFGESHQQQEQRLSGSLRWQF